MAQIQSAYFHVSFEIKVNFHFEFFTFNCSKDFFKVCQRWQFSSSCAISYSSQRLLFCQEHLKSITFMHCKPISSSLSCANQLNDLTMALDSPSAGSKLEFRAKITVENLCFRTRLKESLSFFSTIESLVASDFVAQKWKFL